MSTSVRYELLTTDEVAADLRVSRKTIYRAVRSGQLEAVRIGDHGTLRIAPDAVSRWLRPTKARDEA